MNTLVTGATGFLGSHVARSLTSDGHAARVLVRPDRPSRALDGLDVERAVGDLADERSLVHACRGVEAIVHCAARTGHWSRIATAQREVNVEGSARLFRAARAAGSVRKIVHVSSLATIGYVEHEADVATRRALPETHAWNPRELGIGYVTTKKESEERALAAAWAGMDVVVVNPGMLMGPRFDDRGPSTLVQRIAAGRLRWVPPGGTSVADVEDVARGCVSALERGRKGERYTLGGHNLHWLELYAAIARELGVAAPSRKMPMGFVRAMRGVTSALDTLHLSRPPWAPELYRSLGRWAFVDSGKARAELGYANRPLEETIRRSVGQRTTGDHPGAAPRP